MKINGSHNRPTINQHLQQLFGELITSLNHSVEYSDATHSEHPFQFRSEPDLNRFHKLAAQFGKAASEYYLVQRLQQGQQLAINDKHPLRSNKRFFKDSTLDNFQDNEYREALQNLISNHFQFEQNDDQGWNSDEEDQGGSDSDVVIKRRWIRTISHAWYKSSNFVKQCYWHYIANPKYVHQQEKLTLNYNEINQDALLAFYAFYITWDERYLREMDFEAKQKYLDELTRNEKTKLRLLRHKIRYKNHQKTSMRHDVRFTLEVLKQLFDTLDINNDNINQQTATNLINQAQKSIENHKTPLERLLTTSAKATAFILAFAHAAAFVSIFGIMGPTVLAWIGITLSTPLLLYVVLPTIFITVLIASYAINSKSFPDGIIRMFCKDKFMGGFIEYTDEDTGEKKSMDDSSHRWKTYTLYGCLAFTTGAGILSGVMVAKFFFGLGATVAFFASGFGAGILPIIAITMCAVVIFTTAILALLPIVRLLQTPHWKAAIREPFKEIERIIEPGDNPRKPHNKNRPQLQRQIEYYLACAAFLITIPIFLTILAFMCYFGFGALSTLVNNGVALTSTAHMACIGLSYLITFVLFPVINLPSWISKGLSTIKWIFAHIIVVLPEHTQQTMRNKAVDIADFIKNMAASLFGKLPNKLQTELTELKIKHLEKLPIFPITKPIDPADDTQIVEEEGSNQEQTIILSNKDIRDNADSANIQALMSYSGSSQ